MDYTKLALDIIEPLEQVLLIVRRKPFLTVKAQSTLQGHTSAEANEASLVFTVFNKSSHDIELQNIWFLTSFNRPIFSELLDSKMPVKMLENDRVTYSIPIVELKSALNKSIGETINRVVIFHSSGRQNSGRLSKAIQEELTK